MQYHFFMISQTAYSNTSYNFTYLCFYPTHHHFFPPSSICGSFDSQPVDSKPECHIISISWVCCDTSRSQFAPKRRRRRLPRRRTNLLIISLSAWICPNWINPVSRCRIHLTPPGSEGHFFFFPSILFRLPSFEQQIVKSVDSLDRPAKKVDFIIEVIAWSLKVIHSPSQRQSLVRKVTC